MVSSSGPDVRHVRINFHLRIGLGKPGGWHKDDLATAIAHELQHVVEIAGWPDVVDGVTRCRRPISGAVSIEAAATGHRRGDSSR